MTAETAPRTAADDGRALAAAEQALALEIAGLEALRAGLGPDFARAVNLLYATKGRVIVTGMGKTRFQPALGEATICGLFVETDDRTGRAVDVRMIRQGGRLTEAAP